MRRCCRWMMKLLLAGAVWLSPAVMAEELQPAASQAEMSSAHRSVGLGAAAGLTMALSVLGASYAVARIGSAAIGAAAEKPELLTRSLLFVALAEGLAVLGFAFAMMILQKI